MIGNYDESLSMDYENGFYLTSQPFRMGNILAHYELYKKIINLPGDVVECGVFKGGSLIQFATFRNLLENEGSRKIIGFDVFGEFPYAGNAEDEKFRDAFVKETGGQFLSEGELNLSLELKNIGNVELVKGDILNTLDFYIKDHPWLKIALLHIDTDIYEPSKKALEVLYDRVVRGGVVIADDYGVAGETRAFDEFFGTELNLHKFPFSHNKPSFLIKE